MAPNKWLNFEFVVFEIYADVVCREDVRSDQPFDVSAGGPS